MECVAEAIARPTEADRAQRSAPEAAQVKNPVMSVEQIKDEIRRLRGSEKFEIYRWLDNSVGADFSSRIGADRSRKIRHAIDHMCKVATTVDQRKSAAEDADEDESSFGANKRSH
jgi:hypothetical protein